MKTYILVLLFQWIAFAPGVDVTEEMASFTLKCNEIEGEAVAFPAPIRHYAFELPGAEPYVNSFTGLDFFCFRTYEEGNDGDGNNKPADPDSGAGSRVPVGWFTPSK